MTPHRLNNRFSAFAALLIALYMTLPGSQAGENDSPPKKPNVIFILADDLGYRELGCFGQEKIRTPHLDQLATEGIRLTRHYSGNAVCAPSRCVLMTGKDPGRAWIRNNSEMLPEGQQPIPDAEVTLAEIFRSSGYATGAFGKWGLGGPGSEGDPLRQGFDRFFGYNCQRHAHSFYPDYLWDNDQQIPLMNQPAVPGHAKLPPDADPSDPRSYDQFKGTDYAPDRIREQALKFMTEHRDHPFFLYYPTTLPHVALHVPDAELEPYLALNWQDPPFTAQNGGYTPHFTPRAAYAAMISRMDSDVGQLLGHLKTLGLEDKTIVIFSSDNGTTHLSAEVDDKFFNSVGHLRGLKGSLYEGGIRVPTIVRWPGVVSPGTTTPYVSGFEDWFPTLAEAAGLPIPPDSNRSGVNLIPALKGDATEDRAFLYREFPSYGGQQMMICGDWKLVRQNMTSGHLNSELYNLKADEAETTNAADQHPDIVQRLEKLMADHRIPSAKFPLVPLDQPAATRSQKGKGARK